VNPAARARTRLEPRKRMRSCDERMYFGAALNDSFEVDGRVEVGCDQIDCTTLSTLALPTWTLARARSNGVCGVRCAKGARGMGDSGVAERGGVLVALSL
jgi:hypothetical protein